MVTKVQYRYRKCILKIKQFQPLTLMAFKAFFNIYIDFTSKSYSRHVFLQFILDKDLRPEGVEQSAGKRKTAVNVYTID